MNAISTGTRKPLSFSLRFLFLATTFTAGCCALIVTLPGLGVLLAIIMMSAFARTCLLVHSCGERGLTMPRSEQASLFTKSILRIVLCVILVFATVPVLCLLVFFIILSGLGPAGMQVVMALFAVLMLALLVKMVIGGAKILRFDMSQH